MADDKHKDLNKDKGMNKGGSYQEEQGRQQAPGRDPSHDLETGGRSGGGVQGNRGGIDREDKEREQPGSKQKNQF